MNTNIDGLPAASTISLTDLVELLHSPSGAKQNQKMTLQQLLTTLTATFSPATVGLGNVTNDAQVKLSSYTDRGVLVVGTGASVVGALPPGSDGQVLVAAGDSESPAGLAWASPVAGSAGQIQFNDSGTPGASSVLTFDGTSFKVAGPLLIDDGSGLLTMSGDGSGNFSIAGVSSPNGRMAFNSDGSLSFFDNGGAEIRVVSDGNGGSFISLQGSGSALYFSANGGINISTDSLGVFAINDDGTAAINDAGAAVGISDGSGNWEFFSNLKVDGVLILASTATAPSTSVGAVSTSHYGSGTNYLGTPAAWTTINVGGTPYKIPLY